VEYAVAVGLVRDLVAGHSDQPLHVLSEELERLGADGSYQRAAARRDALAELITALRRAQRLAALAALPELVAARPDTRGGWEFAVIRHGRLASAGTARRGVAPMPVVESMRLGAETVRPGPGPLRGAPAEEVGVLSRWLERPGTRLVHCPTPWTEPALGAGGWSGWLERARAAVAADRFSGGAAEHPLDQLGARHPQTSLA
jgi:DNA polymerase-3 subunit epsilon